jgi:hypothetical protein
MQRRHRLLYVLGCGIAFLLTAPNARGDAPEPAKVSVEFANDAVVINGTKLLLPIQRKDLIRILGKPDREIDLATTALTWDNLGIHALQTRRAETIEAIQIDLAPEGYAFTPKKMFSGSLKVEGATITAGSKIEAINRDMKATAFKKDDVLTSMWKLEYKATVLYLAGADPKKKSPKVVFSSLQWCEKVK